MTIGFVLSWVFSASFERDAGDLYVNQIQMTPLLFVLSYVPECAGDLVFLGLSREDPEACPLAASSL